MRHARRQGGFTARLAVAAVLLAAGGPAAARADAGLAEAEVARARTDCESFESGSFSTESGAVTEVDLTGDGAPDRIIDQSRFRCSSSAGSLWCGTGGCGLLVIADGTVTDLLVKDWRIIDWHEGKILLTAVHGYECGGTNLRWCYEAFVWTDGALRSVSPEHQGR